MRADPEITAAWGRTLGRIEEGHVPDVLTRVHPVAVADGILVLGAGDEQACEELRAAGWTGQLVGELNSELGGPVVRRLVAVTDPDAPFVCPSCVTESPYLQHRATGWCDTCQWWTGDPELTTPDGQQRGDVLVDRIVQRAAETAERWQARRLGS